MMLKRADFERILKDVQYSDPAKFGTMQFDVVDLVPNDGYPSRHGAPPLALRVQQFEGEWGGEDRQKGRKWYLSPHMTKSEVVLTALKAVLTYEEHEARERFRYRGKRIAGPHVDVDFLAECVGKLENLDIREDQTFE